MKKIIAKILLALPGLFILATGLVFLTNPEAAGEKLALAAQGSEGLSNLRGMAGAPLFAVGGFLLLAAITEKLEYARPAALFLLALVTSRLVSYAVDGPTEAIGTFLAVPTIAFALMAAGHTLLVAGERRGGEHVAGGTAAGVNPT